MNKNWSTYKIMKFYKYFETQYISNDIKVFEILCIFTKNILAFHTLYFIIFNRMNIFDFKSMKLYFHFILLTNWSIMTQLLVVTILEWILLDKIQFPQNSLSLMLILVKFVSGKIFSNIPNHQGPILALAYLMIY